MELRNAPFLDIAENPNLITNDIAILLLMYIHGNGIYSRWWFHHKAEIHFPFCNENSEINLYFKQLCHLNGNREILEINGAKQKLRLDSGLQNDTLFRYTKEMK